MMPREPAVVFENVTFQYEAQTEPTLCGINLTIYKGEKVLILGPSGSGKSTLGHLINGLIPRYFKGEIKGSLTVNGQPMGAISAHRLAHSVGTVLQDSDAQFVALSVGEDIAFSLENQNILRRDMLPLVHKAAGLVGMEDKLFRLPYELSGGQKQKAALAGVLHGKVDLLLFDEPLASLDPKAGMEAMELIDELQRSLSITVVIIEHRLEDVLYRPVDRIIVLNGGRIAAQGTPHEILASRVLKSFGIREPLYIGALMDIPPKGFLPAGPLDRLDEIDLEPRRGALEAFAKAEPEQPLKECTPEPLVEFKHVSFAYQDANVLSDINLVIRPGERIALMGENGAGKSTLARLLCGVERPKAGAILLKGQDYLALSIAKLAQTIGYVMQNPNQMLVKDIVAEEVRLALTQRHYEKAEADALVKEALTLTDLYPMRNWPIGALSYGQRKRVTIAAMLALKPSLLILDEPTAGQDYARYTEMMTFVDTLAATQNIAVLFITHDLHLALEYTGRAVILSKGRIIDDGDTFDVLCNEKVLDTASLKQTSLMKIAQRLNMDPAGFVRRYIAFERGRRDG
jgi:energy-coupling factor transport system ATP-binding protein